MNPKGNHPSGRAKPPGADSSGSRRSGKQSERVTDFSYAGLGLSFALTLCVFALVGYWLDGKWGTKPWLMVAGVLLGGLGATISLIKKVPAPRGGRSSTTSKQPSSAAKPPSAVDSSGERSQQSSNPDHR